MCGSSGRRDCDAPRTDVETYNRGGESIGVLGDICDLLGKSEDDIESQTKQCVPLLNLCNLVNSKVCGELTPPL
jgi:hypothetical protein